MRIEARLEKLGLTLPAPLVPPGNFRLVKLHNGLAYISGHGPFDGAKLLVEGLIGRELTLEQGYDAARKPRSRSLRRSSASLATWTGSPSGFEQSAMCTAYRVLLKTPRWSMVSAI